MPQTKRHRVSGSAVTTEFLEAEQTDSTSDQRGCRVNRRAVDVSPGIVGVGLDDGATQKATQGFKPLEAHKTRWAVVPSES